MFTRDLIVVGMSTGGVEALVRLVKGLPADFPAALAVVQHMPALFDSKLPDILSAAGPLPAEFPHDRQAIRRGEIYVAPPDYHLLVEPGRLRLSHGARENRFRPAIDPLFRSAARHYGDRVIAVLLTGGPGDGVAGMVAVRHAGGVAVVQDPDDAFLAALPRTAINIAGADYILRVADMPALLNKLVREGQARGGSQMTTDPIDTMPEIVDQDMLAQATDQRRGLPSVYSCPECGGVLWQVDQQELARFRCHVGHAYYADQLLEGQAEALEAALWTAVRIFREQANLARQLVLREREHGNREIARRYQEQEAVAERHGRMIKEVLLNKETGLFPPAGNGPGNNGQGGNDPSLEARSTAGLSSPEGPKHDAGATHGGT